MPAPRAQAATSTPARSANDRCARSWGLRSAPPDPGTRPATPAAPPAVRWHRAVRERLHDPPDERLLACVLHDGGRGRRADRAVVRTRDRRGLPARNPRSAPGHAGACLGERMTPDGTPHRFTREEYARRLAL